MRKELSELMGGIEKYNDSVELSEALESISHDLDSHDAYILKEAAINLSQLWKLISDIKYEQASEEPTKKPVYYHDSDKQKRLMCEALEKEEPHELDFPIIDFEFTTRTNTILNREGIKTAKDLCVMTWVELRKLNGLGKKSLNEIVQTVDAHGLNLGIHL